MIKYMIWMNNLKYHKSRKRLKLWQKKFSKKCIKCMSEKCTWENFRINFHSIKSRDQTAKAIFSGSDKLWFVVKFFFSRIQNTFQTFLWFLICIFHPALLRLPSDWFLFYKILNTTSLENFFLGKTVAGAPGASG